MLFIIVGWKGGSMRKFTEEQYNKYKELFYLMWRDNMGEELLDEKGNVMHVTTSCPACTIAGHVVVTTSRLGISRALAIIPSLDTCLHCPIDWSYLPDADKIDPPYCRAEGSRYNRYKEALDSCGYDISPEVKEVVQEIIDKTKWRSYDELMHTKRMRRR